MKSLPLIVIAALAALFTCWLGVHRGSHAAAASQTQTSMSTTIRTTSIDRVTQSGDPHTIHSPATSRADPATWVRQVVQSADGDAEELARLADEIPLFRIPGILAEISAAEMDPSRAALAAVLLRKWAHHEPEDAARWLAGVPAGTFPSSIFHEVIAEWATKDVPAMLMWVSQLPESKSKNAALVSAGFEAAARNQAPAAVAIAVGLAPSPERDRLLNYSVLQWMNEDISRAMYWLDRVPDRALREDLLAKVAVELGVQNDPRAASEIATALPAGRTRDAVLGEVLQSWARSAPKDAAEWVSESAGGDFQPAAVDNLVAVWGQRDWLSAGEWVMKLPPGPAFDAGARSYAFVLKSAHPNLALNLAESIGDDSERTSVLHELRRGQASAAQ